MQSIQAGHLRYRRKRRDRFFVCAGRYAARSVRDRRSVRRKRHQRTNERSVRLPRFLSESNARRSEFFGIPARKNVVPRPLGNRIVSYGTVFCLNPLCGSGRRHPLYAGRQRTDRKFKDLYGTDRDHRIRHAARHGTVRKQSAEQDPDRALSVCRPAYASGRVHCL